MSASIEKRQIHEKELLLEHLKRIPIVEVACKKSGVSRATFYRWKHQFPDFATQADEAIEEGVRFINDMAESQLLTAIKDGDIKAIFYWLNHRHSSYGNKIEITTNDTLKDRPLTDEQKKAMEIALGVLNKKGGDSGEHKS